MPKVHDNARKGLVRTVNEGNNLEGQHSGFGLLKCALTSSMHTQIPKTRANQQYVGGCAALLMRVARRMLS